MLHIIILAAGAGQRMHSNISKVMHEVAGTPMIKHVFNTAALLNPNKIHIVVKPKSQDIIESFNSPLIEWAIQEKQLGTAHAIQQAIPNIPKDAQVLILYADVPLITESTLTPLISQMDSSKLCLLLAKLDNPFGMGRVIRNNKGAIQSIIEEKDATPSQKNIQEIYTGICCINAETLHDLLPKISNNNAQNEYYLTDIIALAVQANLSVSSVTANNNDDILGVNNRAQLENVERIFQKRLAHTLMLKGVTIADSNRIDIRGSLQCGTDVYIDVNNVFIDNIDIGNNSIIEPNCILTNVKIGNNTIIKANSILDNCIIGDDCQIGPFTRLRPGSEINNKCAIGNFVEVKNTKIAENSKANHLSYLGDAIIGKNVNIGAGTITCNYDGAHKHQTIIEDGVFIGSDTQLVAPVTVGSNATIGAGSTIRKDVPKDDLTLTTSVQKTIHGWQRPKKKNGD